MHSATNDPVLEERRALLRFARHLCRSYQDADDLVQEALLRQWRHQPTFPSEGHRRAWLKRVVLNGHIDERRRDKRARAWTSRAANEGDGPVQPVGVAGISPAMQRHLETLPVDYRNVLFVVDVWEQSYQEAAEQLGCPIGTVMSRLHRARRRLRELLAHEQAPVSRAQANEMGTEAVAA